MSKLDDQKKSLFVQSSIYIAMVVVTGAIFYGSYLYHNSKAEELKDLKNKAASIKNKETAIRNEYNIFQEPLEQYQHIPENKKATADGYTKSAMRIRTLKDTIDKLKEKYYFPYIRFSTSTIDEKTETFDFKKLKIFSSQVTIEYGAMSDELVFSFINDFMDELPGYVLFKSVTVEKKGEITADLIDSIVKKHAILPLTEGVINFSWHTAQDSDLASSQEKKKKEDVEDIES